MTYDLDVIYFQLDKTVVVTNGVQRVNLILYLFVLTVKKENMFIHRKVFVSNKV